MQRISEESNTSHNRNFIWKKNKKKNSKIKQTPDHTNIFFYLNFFSFLTNSFSTLDSFRFFLFLLFSIHFRFSCATCKCYSKQAVRDQKKVSIVATKLSANSSILIDVVLRPIWSFSLLFYIFSLRNFGTSKKKLPYCTNRGSIDKHF